MKIDAREIAALTQAQPAAPRMDMYASIHKALRAFMADTLLGLGRMDVDDDLEFAQTCDRVMQLLDLCRAHLHHENQFVHTAMQARAPGTCAAIEAEHTEHEATITALAGGVAHLLGCARAARPATTHVLYRQLALFMAHNFEHMNEEETAHNRVLWQHYTDEELVRIHDALVASIPPQEMMGATLTLSNFGTLFGRYANPVIVPPQVAILGAGGIRDEPVAWQGQVVIHPILPLSLTFDHRVATGGEAARFLKALVDALEQADA